MPGTIHQTPGGVALNIARTLAKQGHRPALIAAIGRDAAGKALVAEIGALGIDSRFLVRSDTLPTDTYLAIEGANGLIAAIATAAALESMGMHALAPLHDGRLGSDVAPWRGAVVLDSGLTPTLISELAHANWLCAADLRLTAASPVKAARLRAFMGRPRCSFYLNLAEAGQICGTPFADSARAARALLALGAARVLVTDGPNAATDADAHVQITRPPPATAPQRVTGAGDLFMAAHIAQELAGTPRQDALDIALRAAAAYVADAPHLS